MGELNLLSLNMPSVEAAHGEVEMPMVGAIDTNFNKTQDLHVMNYKEAMEDPRVEDVKEGIKTEHDKFLRYGIWKAILFVAMVDEDNVRNYTGSYSILENGVSCYRIHWIRVVQS